MMLILGIALIAGVIALTFHLQTRKSKPPEFPPLSTKAWDKVE